MSNILDFKPKSNKVGELETGNLYEMNKQLLQEKEPLTHLELAKIQEDIDDWFNWTIDCYAMLLCHDRRDYTVFHLYENQNLHPTEIAAKELMGCLTDRGDIIAMDRTKDGAYEIWLRIDNKMYCYYLFCYDDAVIEC